MFEVLHHQFFFFFFLNSIMSVFSAFTKNHPTRTRFLSFSSLNDSKKLKRPLFYYVSGFSANLQIMILRNSGFKETKNVEKATLIIGETMNKSKISQLKFNQKINHFAYTFSIGTKKGLHKVMKEYAEKFNRFPDFYPETYLLPYERYSLQSSFKTSKFWIMKPASGARGNGIRVISRFPDQQTSRKVVVQKYIRNPLLINGLKFDLRFYVAVVSLDPLIVFLYNNGLVRFATAPYESGNDNDDKIENVGNDSTPPKRKKGKRKSKITSLKIREAHLTNYSVNRNKKDYVETNNLEDDGKGSKWSHHPFWPYLESIGFNVHEIRKKIEDAFVTIILGAHRSLKLQTNHFNSFELFGFDVLIDTDQNIHVLEVNTSPAMGISTELDKSIKGPLISDLFNISLIPVQTKVNSRVSRLMTYDHSRESLKARKFVAINKFETTMERCQDTDFKLIYPTLERDKSFRGISDSISILDKCLMKWLEFPDSKKISYLEKLYPYYENAIKKKE